MPLSSSIFSGLFNLDEADYLSVSRLTDVLEQQEASELDDDEKVVAEQLSRLIESVEPAERESLKDALGCLGSVAHLIDDIVQDLQIDPSNYDIPFIKVHDAAASAIRALSKFGGNLGEELKSLQTFCEQLPEQFSKTLLILHPEWQKALKIPAGAVCFADENGISLVTEASIEEEDYHRSCVAIPLDTKHCRITVELPSNVEDNRERLEYLTENTLSFLSSAIDRFRLGEEEPSKPLCCSFCNRGQNEVKKLIAGPEVYICNECVDMCRDIVADEMQ